MPRTVMHVIAEDVDRPSSVLISTVPYKDFDAAEGLVVPHDTGTGWTGAPVRLQSMLKHDDWKEPSRDAIYAEVGQEVLDLLAASR